MRILIAPDKFKGSLDARQVGDNIASGLHEVLPGAVIETMPVADGGEGTAGVIRQALGGETIGCAAHDALGREIEASYVWLSDRATAVMEMSAAAGMWRIAPKERDLLRADTFGVGEMIKDAIRRDAQEILIGLGGSATNDGGFGMARALGFQFFANEHEVESPAELVNAARIRIPTQRFSGTITAAVDVRNPLLGPRGATHTFGPQKSGTVEQVEMLESGLRQMADIVTRDLGCDFRDTPGAGAAGGLGFGLMSFCGATIKSGFDVVAEFIGLREAIARADIVITGEGRLDEQSLEGKAPAGVARMARGAGKRVFAIAGSATDTRAVRALFDDVLVLARPPITPEQSIARTAELLQERARELARMM
ncbi:MAG TPA: glycerate kinase [Chthoniobacterales bacterium]|nr:glycerate kinase [Chthoniobacterales bacterium]